MEPEFDQDQEQDDPDIRPSLRGAGQPASGPLLVTYHLWKIVEARPGIGREELIGRTRPFVDVGYARRWINARRAWDLRRRGESVRAEAVARTDVLSHIDADGAVRQVILSQLASMLRYQSLKREDDRFFVARPLKRTPAGWTEEFLDHDGSRSRKAIATMELRKTLLKMETRGADQNRQLSVETPGGSAHELARGEPPRRLEPRGSVMSRPPGMTEALRHIGTGLIELADSLENPDASASNEIESSPVRKEDIGVLLSLQQVADLCGVTERTVRNWIEHAELTAVRLGKRVIRVRESDLTRFLE